MKFFLKSEWTLEEGCYVTTKQYHCPNCHYVRKIREKNGETEVLEFVDRLDEEEEFDLLN